MASAKEHLAVEIHGRHAAHHDAAATFHDAKSKSHSEHASIHRELHKASGMTEDMDGPHRRLAGRHELDAQLHKDYAAHHRAQAAAHRSAAEACMKATDAADLGKRGNELQPLPAGFSRLTPTTPADGLRAVPRIGAAPPQKPAVPLDFEKTFSVEDDETDLRGAQTL
jgi:hypothetical protein